MPLLYDAKYWRDRADEARVTAETMVTQEGRQTLLEIAKLHDRMAAMSERIRERDLAPHPTGGDGKG
jgi:C4-dicarboxylate-specific signal transduction histidine kinase